MSDWVTHKNVGHFRRMLAEEKDPEKRRILEELLAKELLKLSDAYHAAEGIRSRS